MIYPDEAINTLTERRIVTVISTFWWCAERWNQHLKKTKQNMHFVPTEMITSYTLRLWGAEKQPLRQLSTGITAAARDHCAQTNLSALTYNALRTNRSNPNVRRVQLQQNWCCTQKLRMTHHKCGMNNHKAHRLQNSQFASWPPTVTNSSLQQFETENVLPTPYMRKPMKKDWIV